MIFTVFLLAVHYRESAYIRFICRRIQRWTLIDQSGSAAQRIKGQPCPPDELLPVDRAEVAAVHAETGIISQHQIFIFIQSELFSERKRLTAHI